MEKEETLYDDLIVIGEAEFKNRWVELQNTPIPCIYIQKVAQLKNRYSCFNIKTDNYTNNRHGDNGTNRNNRNNRNNGDNKNNRDNKYDRDLDPSMVGNKGGHTGIRKNRYETKQDVEYPVMKSMRPRIGPLFTNTEGKARKNFIAFMNKLSPLNKNEILPNFIKSLLPDNINIYMDQMISLFQIQPTYHDLYTEVMFEIMAISPNQAKLFLEQHFHNFIKEEKYKISTDVLLGLERADNKDETSDGLCEYTKWKKNMKSLIICYIRLISHKLFGSNDDLELLFTMLANICNENWDRHKLLEIYLDIMLCSVQSIYKHEQTGLLIIPSIINYFQDWDAKKETLLPSSRFKVMDIMDIVNVNNNSNSNSIGNNNGNRNGIVNGNKNQKQSIYQRKNGKDINITKK